MPTERPKEPHLGSNTGHVTSPVPTAPLKFAPYGFMPSEYLADMTPLVPSGWRDHTGGATLNFDAWLARLTERLAVLMWPTFDRNRSAWPDTRLDQMSALTRADFRVMEEIAKEAPLTRVPVSTVPPMFGTHDRLFQSEDKDGVDGLARSLIQYVSLPPSLDVRSAGLPISRGLTKCGGFVLKMKLDFQRPRAYQVAYGIPAMVFEHHWATSAVTPALPSGHCLEGSISVANVYAEQHDGAWMRGPGVAAALSQLAVDIGDRRVYAGVHYPSDNLASWIIALNLVPHVFEASAPVRDFLSAAIRDRSAVFARILASGLAPYDAALAELQQLFKDPGYSSV